MAEHPDNKGHSESDGKEWIISSPEEKKMAAYLNGLGNKKRSFGLGDPVMPISGDYPFGIGFQVFEIDEDGGEGSMVTIKAGPNAITTLKKKDLFHIKDYHDARKATSKK